MKFWGKNRIKVFPTIFKKIWFHGLLLWRKPWLWPTRSQVQLNMFMYIYNKDLDENIASVLISNCF